MMDTILNRLYFMKTLLFPTNEEIPLFFIRNIPESDREDEDDDYQDYGCLSDDSSISFPLQFKQLEGFRRKKFDCRNLYAKWGEEERMIGREDDHDVVDIDDCGFEVADCSLWTNIHPDSGVSPL